MSFNSQAVRRQISLGIKAQKAGDNSAAWLHFQAALREDPENTIALLWLAFIAPDFEKQVFLLERILQIDPQNERAQKGLRWVKDKMAAAEAAGQQSGVSPASEGPPSLSDIKEELSSSDLKEQAKKGTIAQRARRRINPFIVLLIGACALTSVLAGGLFLLDGPVSSAAPAPSATAVPPTDTPTPLPPTPTLTPVPPTDTPTPLPPSPTATPVSPTDTPSPPTPTPLPLAYQPAFPGEKWIEVDLSRQTVTAWDGDRPAMSFLASTGLPNTPTVTGKFRVYQKLVSTRMTGPGYDLPNVPHTMYFYGGYALHGAYWHNNFGQPMSHGCVNLALADAETLFNWAAPTLPKEAWSVNSSAANPGTLVIVHQ